MNCVNYFREAETENVVADLTGRQEPTKSTKWVGKNKFVHSIFRETEIVFKEMVLALV